MVILQMCYGVGRGIMRDIRKVVILGAGAMGAYFVTRFLDTPGFSAAVVARDKRYEHLKREGLVVNGQAHINPGDSPGRKPPRPPISLSWP